MDDLRADQILFGGMEPGYNLRERERKNIFELYDVNEEDLCHGQEEERGFLRRRRERKRGNWGNGEDYQYNGHDSDGQGSDIFDQNAVVDRLPQNRAELSSLMRSVKLKLKNYRDAYFNEQRDIKHGSFVGQNSVPICADVTKYDFNRLIRKQLECTAGCLFDVIMMDPPWKLSTSQPSRGVAIQYDSLADEYIQGLPIKSLQKEGVLLVWAINAKYAFSIELMERWGYTVVDSITWVKKTVNGKIAKGHGYYLQHAKETCLVGVKGNNPKLRKGVARDVIFSDRRGQSQKPEQIYDYVEQLVPNGYYLQIFGRRNNLRDKWVTIGNEI